MKVNNNRQLFLIITVFLIIVLYFMSGAYSLENGQKAMVILFGKAQEEVSNPGIHYSLPWPINKKIKVYTSKVETISINDVLDEKLERLTGDENLIVVNALVSYDIKNLFNYLYKCDDVKRSLRSIGQMCLTRELTKMAIDDVMTTGKSLLRLVVKEKLQEMADEMGLGVRIISVELTDISPPASVSDAFNSVSNARVKKQEIIRDAEGYANSILPKARGDASTIMSTADAYSKETISNAEGSVSAFNEMVVEYQKNPKMTLNVKMLETMKTVLQKSIVKVDTNPSQSIHFIYE
ncbi:MAG: FtsH protease activity modulator HflK [Deltaproteobacteria bacterium]|nr:FtsH protease activity modulator HflK [Deltaproteobacteria bacterium]